jgi:hypothetical protein
MPLYNSFSEDISGKNIFLTGMKRKDIKISKDKGLAINQPQKKRSC